MFATMFLAQVVIAGAVAAVIVASVGWPSARPSALGPVLAVLALLQCGLAVVISSALARSANLGRTLSATLLAAVMLATPAWFLMLALVTGQRGLSLLVLGSAVPAGYALGFVLTGRFARLTAADAREQGSS